VRVLVLSLHFFPDTVSNAVVVTQMAEELAARGHRVTVISAMPYHQAHQIESGYRGKLWSVGRHGTIKVIRTWLMLRGGKRDVGKRFLAYASFNVTSTLAALFSGRYDVVISPSPPLTIGLSGWLLARLWGARFVYNVQDIYPDAAIKLGLLRGRKAISFFKWLEKFVYARADAVTVLSDDFRHNLRAKGVPDAKLEVIPNPVDTAFIRPTPSDNGFSREHALNGRFVALYAGNIGLAQHIETLIDAAACVQRPETLVLVVGSGAGLDSARAHAASVTRSNVRFLPFQPRERIPEMYASANVGVVLLKAGMGDTSTPSKLFTIMAAGLPVVAAVDPGTEVWRLVQSIGCGVCVPPEDPTALARALDSLAVDLSNTRALGERGRAYVESHYTRHIVGEQYHTLIASLGRDRQHAG
jgi:colanic acid biosynthesis glycosyl transferase WcaI